MCLECIDCCERRDRREEEGLPVPVCKQTIVELGVRAGRQWVYTVCYIAVASATVASLEQCPCAKSAVPSEESFLAPTFAFLDAPTMLRLSTRLALGCSPAGSCAASAARPSRCAPSPSTTPTAGACASPYAQGARPGRRLHLSASATPPFLAGSLIHVSYGSSGWSSPSSLRSMRRVTDASYFRTARAPPRFEARSTEPR